MQRITISIDEALGAAFDDMIRSRGYQSRSESVRDLVREAVEGWSQSKRTGGMCVANLSFVHDRSVRSLAARLTKWRHDHHDLIIAATSAPLDHRSTLESLMMSGPAGAVRALADGVRAERGVSFAVLNLIGIEGGDDHQAPGAHHHTGHRHLSPRLS